MSNLIMQGEDAFEAVRRTVGEALGEPAFDEVAIMVAHADAAAALIRKSGLVYFNAADDNVQWGTGSGATSRYTVHYDFLAGEGKRYEVMHLTSGTIGPVHEAHARILDAGAKGSVVHVSYKPEEPSFLGYMREMERLLALGFVPVQRCHSTYGLFSYWTYPGLPDGVFVKPRVNLRDRA